MADITNKKYITIKHNGCFVGGKTAKYYRSKPIHKPYYTCFVFAEYLQKCKIQEIHVLTSETQGVELKPGVPSWKHGKYIWCRVKMINGTLGNWICSGPACDSDTALMYCVKDCIDNIWEGMLGKVILPKQKGLEKRRSEIINSGLANIR